MILLSFFELQLASSLLQLIFIVVHNKNLDFLMHTLISNVFMFGGCDELCLKVVKERTWATTSSSMDMDHSMFTIIIKLESNKLKVLESNLHGFFFFFFLCAYSFIIFSISCFQDSPYLLL